MRLIQFRFNFYICLRVETCCVKVEMFFFVFFLEPIHPAAWELEVPPDTDQSKKINFSGTSSAFHKVQQNGNVHSQGDTFGRYFNSCIPPDGKASASTKENMLSDFFSKLLKQNGDKKDEKVNGDVPNSTSSSAVRSDLQNGVSSPSQTVKRTDEVFEVNQFLSNGHKKFSSNGAAAACKNSPDICETRDVFDFSEFLKDENNGSFGNFVATSQDGPTIDVTEPPTNGNDRSSENPVANGGKIDIPVNFFQYLESSVDQHVASTSQSASSFVAGNHSTQLPNSSVPMDRIPIFFTAKAAGLGLPTESDKFGKKHKRSSVYGQNKKS